MWNFSFKLLNSKLHWSPRNPFGFKDCIAIHDMTDLAGDWLLFYFVLCVVVVLEFHIWAKNNNTSSLKVGKVP